MPLKQKMFISSLAGAFLSLALPAAAHIDLKAPAPILSGRAQDFQALKSPPFGAPGVDIAAASATTVKAGSVIDIRVEVYVYHPGDIVVLYTTDPEGRDIEPAWSIPHEGADIPFHNLLYMGKTPDHDDTDIFEASVPLPDIEGEIYLVVRQVMHDKFDKMEDGSVSLRRVYYHQAAKLKLVR